MNHSMPGRRVAGTVYRHRYVSTQTHPRRPTKASRLDLACPGSLPVVERHWTGRDTGKIVCQVEPVHKSTLAWADFAQLGLPCLLPVVAHRCTGKDAMGVQKETRLTWEAHCLRQCLVDVGWHCPRLFHSERVQEWMWKNSQWDDATCSLAAPWGFWHWHVQIFYIKGWHHMLALAAGSTVHVPPDNRHGVLHLLLWGVQGTS